MITNQINPNLALALYFFEILWEKKKKKVCLIYIKKTMFKCKNPPYHLSKQNLRSLMNVNHQFRGILDTSKAITTQIDQ